MVRSLLGVALDHCDFRKLVAGNLGTHSIRKGAATYCAKCGVSKDHIELRGRWSGHKKQVDTYIDIERSFPDAQVAARLCGPNGAARYILVENTWCNPSYLANIVAPNCARAFSNEIAQLLAIPLIYAAVQSTSTFDSEYPLLPEPLQQRILNSIRLAANIDVDSDVPQFVEKVAILPSGFDGDLRLVDMSGEMAELGGQATSSTAVIAALLSQSTEINALKRRIEEVHSQHQAELASLQTTMRSQFERLHSTIKRITVQPVVRSVTTPTDHGAPGVLSRPTARLTKRPRDLFELWKEYEFGIGGVKPAKLFNEKERGKAKFVFCFRLKFWVLVEGMLKRGHTSDTAIDAIYLKYRRSKSVTAILTLLRHGKPQRNEF
ncbi:hypothetical protein DYB32_010143 [Aphanomyces invadans]|uniref:Uncharacterized protein n=1 Tax=Aphanomyces invadans TaxID=157072 RepID=A0A3R6YWT0_9STRA|nr:hypothetical protein DYB32_010143 [Aphanomyces invadans]